MAIEDISEVIGRKKGSGNLNLKDVFIQLVLTAADDSSVYSKIKALYPALTILEIRYQITAGNGLKTMKTMTVFGNITFREVRDTLGITKSTFTTANNRVCGLAIKSWLWILVIAILIYFATKK